MEFHHVIEICGRERGGRGNKGHGEAGCCWALSLAEDAQLHFAHFIAAYATNVSSVRNVLGLHMCMYICNVFLQDNNRLHHIVCNKIFHQVHEFLLRRKLKILSTVFS